jgi:peptidoglycan/xylan/chitin deacetylase (PgdA/CDA1 family)
LTFDDGFANFYTEAFPVLREFGMTACVFLVTDFIGGRAEWLARDRSVIEDTVASLPQGRTERSLQVERLVSLAEEPLLTWPQVREMAEAGIEFHGHTASHPFLPNLPSAEVEAEVRGCMEVLASVLGPAPRFFAYPYGASTLAARATLNALACPGAFTADPPRARERSLDPLAIPRVGVPGWGSLSDFRFRLSRGVELTGGLRKARALNGSL